MFFTAAGPHSTTDAGFTLALAWGLVAVAIVLIPVLWVTCDRVRSKYLAERRCLACDTAKALVSLDGDGWQCERCGEVFTLFGRRLEGDKPERFN